MEIRPDFAFILSVLSRFLSNSFKKHLKATHHLLHYINETLNEGIMYGADDRFYEYINID